MTRTAAPQPFLPGMEPPPAPKWPRLSVTLAGPRDLRHCQSCAYRGTLPGAAEPRTMELPELQVWCEHDDADRAEEVYVALCERCADALVERHKRLYSPIDPQAPRPGVMPACVECAHRRDGFRCGHPDASANGGAGLKLAFPRPSVFHLDYRGAGGRRMGANTLSYRGPVTCAGRTERSAD